MERMMERTFFPLHYFCHSSSLPLFCCILAEIVHTLVLLQNLIRTRNTKSSFPRKPLFKRGHKRINKIQLPAVPLLLRATCLQIWMAAACPISTKEGSEELRGLLIEIYWTQRYMVKPKKYFAGNLWPTAVICDCHLSFWDLAMTRVTRKKTFSPVSKRNFTGKNLPSPQP